MLKVLMAVLGVFVLGSFSMYVKLRETYVLKANHAQKRYLYSS